MGFMDKAKKMAEQAQEKLDEVQTQFNEGQAKRADQAAADQAPVDQAPADDATEAAAPEAPAKPSGDTNATPDPFKPIE